MTSSWRKLVLGVDTAQFAPAIRNCSLVGLVVTSLSEGAAYLSPDFPKDTLGSGVMAAAFAVTAVVAHLVPSRRVVGLFGIATFGVIGWYLARVLLSSGGALSPHQGAVYLAGRFACLPFRVVAESSPCLFSRSLAGKREQIHQTPTVLSDRLRRPKAHNLQIMTREHAQRQSAKSLM